MPTNINNFTKQLKEFNKRVAGELLQFHKTIVISVYKEIVTLSPVWSGQFRASNVIAINGIDTSVSLNSSAQETMWPDSPPTILPPRDDKYIMGALSPLKAFQLVNISNSIPYASFLEAGGSKMAPAGVYLIAATKVAFRFRDSKRVNL